MELLMLELTDEQYEEYTLGLIELGKVINALDRYRCALEYKVKKN